jgi:hypothetical protein
MDGIDLGPTFELCSFFCKQQREEVKKTTCHGALFFITTFMEAKIGRSCFLAFLNRLPELDHLVPSSSKMVGFKAQSFEAKNELHPLTQQERGKVDIVVRPCASNGACSQPVSKWRSSCMCKQQK